MVIGQLQTVKLPGGRERPDLLLCEDDARCLAASGMTTRDDGPCQTEGLSAWGGKG